MKNMHKSTIWISMCSLLLAIVACQPQEEVNPQPGMLTNGSTKTWRMTDAKKDGLSAPNKSCLVGDLYTFGIDKAFVFDEGTEKCGTEQKVTGAWELANSTIVIRENGTKTFVVLVIKSLNQSRMVTQVDNNGGDPIEYTFTAL